MPIKTWWLLCKFILIGLLKLIIFDIKLLKYYKKVIKFNLHIHNKTRHCDLLTKPFPSTKRVFLSKLQIYVYNSNILPCNATLFTTIYPSNSSSTLIKENLKKLKLYYKCLTSIINKFKYIRIF